MTRAVEISPSSWRRRSLSTLGSRLASVWREWVGDGSRFQGSAASGGQVGFRFERRDGCGSVPHRLWCHPDSLSSVREEFETLFRGRNEDRLPESFQLRALPSAGLFYWLGRLASPTVLVSFRSGPSLICKVITMGRKRSDLCHDH